jgi:hypothetical protein
MGSKKQSSPARYCFSAPMLAVVRRASEWLCKKRSRAHPFVTVLPLDHSSQRIQISHGVATQKHPDLGHAPCAHGSLLPLGARRRGVGGHSGTAWPLFFSDGTTKEKAPSRIRTWGLSLSPLRLLELSGPGCRGTGTRPARPNATSYSVALRSFNVERRRRDNEHSRRPRLLLLFDCLGQKMAVPRHSTYH